MRRAAGWRRLANQDADLAFTIGLITAWAIW